MLRNALLAFAILLAVCGIGGLLLGYPSWAPAIWGVVLVACVLFERWRYQKPRATTQGNSRPTGEQFIDPESGQAMEVWYDPDTGERSYEPVKSPRQ